MGSVCDGRYVFELTRDSHTLDALREVGGLKEAKNEITELITGIPKDLIKFGGKQAKAAIMLGPPGVGKSLICSQRVRYSILPCFWMAVEVHRGFVKYDCLSREQEWVVVH